MKESKTKVSSIILDVLLVIIVAAIMFVSINAIVSNNRGYTSFFGNVLYAAETDSMNGSREGSFDAKALIFSKELSTDEAKKDLKRGEIITFWFWKGNERKLNTHRIVDILDEGGANVMYITQGDKPGLGIDASEVYWSDVVAVYQSHVEKVGGVVLFVQSQTGFLIVVVLPAVLIFAYCAFAFVSRFKEMKKEQKAEVQAETDKVRLEEEKLAQKEMLRQELLAQKEALRQELLAEMQAEKKQAEKKAKKDNPPDKN